jgi:hypothetical protein
MTSAHSQPPSRTRPPRILIVEDDLVIALMIEEFVREFGYAVSSVAGTVAMARLQIAQRNFDAVLLDINMEGEYQPETADVLLEAGVPFAFVTGYDYVLEPRHEGVPRWRSRSGLFNSASCWRSWSDRDHRPAIAHAA